MQLQILDLRKFDIKSKLFGILNAVGDDGFPMWYRFIKPHFEEIGISVNLKSYETVNKNKPFIINVAVQGWVWYNFDGDILDDFAPFKKDLINGNAYLLLNHEWEVDGFRFIEKLYYLLKKSRIPPKKIIYLVNNLNIDHVLKIFAEKNKITKNELITTIFSPHCFNNIGSHEIQLFEYNQNSIKNKKYIFLNRQIRTHKAYVASLLSYYNLLNEGYVSFGEIKNDINFEKLEKDTKVSLGFKTLKSKLPILLDTPLDFNHVGFIGMPFFYFEKSYFSLVSGTFAFKEDSPELSITEKEIKAILMKHPFLLINGPGTLKHMRDMGFMTFSNWFDESYDLIEDDLERLNKVALEVKRLCSLTSNDWDIMKKEMQPILLHNYNRAVNYSSERCYFSADLKKLLYYVS